MNYQIAIDGPAGAGKSTIAKIVAEKLGYVYIDTGAMYRAMGLFFKRMKGFDASEGKMRALLEEADILLVNENNTQRVFLNGEDVTEAIREEDAGMNASRVSAYPPVREKLVELQRRMAKSTSVVMDGRDIGTVVLPDARLKIFLTADTHVRALRRQKQLAEKGVLEDLKTIEEDIVQRDLNDKTREVSPLKQADDAVLIDTSFISIEETIDKILKLQKEHVCG